MGTATILSGNSNSHVGCVYMRRYNQSCHLQIHPGCTYGKSNNTFWELNKAAIWMDDDISSYAHMRTPTMVFGNNDKPAIEYMRLQAVMQTRKKYLLK